MNSERNRAIPVNSPKRTLTKYLRTSRGLPKLVYEFADSAITILNGKHTNHLGVEKLQVPSGGMAEVTSIERTLIDITVRPNHVGGVSRVLEAFAAAKGRVSTRAVLGMLKKLDYTYPFHQAIGFYLKRAGYSIGDQELFARMGTRFDFYLSHGASRPVFDREWRIWYPHQLN